MSQDVFEIGFLDEDDDFDPLAAADDEIDQEDMEDENPYDTVDYPTVRNMPEHMQRDAVYTPATQGSAEAAISALFDRNPARRPELLAILGLCREGCSSSKVTEQIEEFQKENRSVYAPLTLCRMLERAGALELEMPEVAEEVEDVETGVEFLEIKERVDPVWKSTAAGMDAFEREMSGAAFWDILERDGGGSYVEVYRTLLEALAEEPRKREWIEETVDSFEVVQHPRRFGGHFIDMLEKTYCIQWRNPHWCITDLGRSALVELQVKE